MKAKVLTDERYFISREFYVFTYVEFRSIERFASENSIYIASLSPKVSKDSSPVILP